MFTSNANRVISYLINVLQNPMDIDYTDINQAYTKRIIVDNERTDGKQIDSPTGLHKTGFLDSVLSIDKDGVTVPIYADSLEKRYGVIFDINEKEANLIGEALVNKANIPQE